LGSFDLSEYINDIIDEIEEGFAVRRVYPVKGAGLNHARPENMPQRIIAVALKMGMSLRDLNELTTQALVDIVHEFAGGAGGQNETRAGTPKEAAAYFAGGR
jgi:hypothetical protein